MPNCDPKTPIWLMIALSSFTIVNFSIAAVAILLWIRLRHYYLHHDAITLTACRRRHVEEPGTAKDMGTVSQAVAATGDHKDSPDLAPSVTSQCSASAQNAASPQQQQQQ
eukprot:scpid105940/ scgid24300/ 